MAKSPKRQAKKVGGPFLAAAVFCDNVLEEKPTEGKSAGVVSAIRIYDTVTVTVPEDLPPNMVAGMHLKALLTFRAGDSPGKHTLQLVSHSPDRKKFALPESEIRFKGKGHHGVNLTLNIGFPARVDGLYWFDVLLDGRQITRMPLMVVIQKDKQTESSPKPAK